MNHKQEADKILTEILKIIGSNCEHDSYCGEDECNRIKGITICNVDYEKARKLAILQVNAQIRLLSKFMVIEEEGAPTVDMLNTNQGRFFQSILTELEKK